MCWSVRQSMKGREVVAGKFLNRQLRERTCYTHIGEHCRWAAERGISIITNRALTAFGGPSGQSTYKLCDYQPESEHLGGGLFAGKGSLPLSSSVEPSFGTSLQTSRTYEQVLEDTIVYFTPEFLHAGEGVDLESHIAQLPEDLRDTAEACAFILAVIKDLNK